MFVHGGDYADARAGSSRRKDIRAASRSNEVNRQQTRTAGNELLYGCITRKIIDSPASMITSISRTMNGILIFNLLPGE